LSRLTGALDALGGAFDLVVGIDLVGRSSLTFESLCRVHTGACRSLFYQVFSRLSVCMCLTAGRYFIVLYSLHGSVVYVLCVLKLKS
jgi:hypothetical protein